MRYWVLASTVTFSSFAIGLSLLSGMVAAFATLNVRSIGRRSSVSRASALLWLRLFPLVGAGAFAAALVLPTYLYYEPSHTDEPLRRTMAAVAAIGLVIIIRAAWRVGGTWLATRRLARRWARSGRPAPDVAPGLPAFVIDEAFPTVAVIGCVRPTLFVSQRVFDECTPDEIAAMVAHERAHIAARDNVKRLLLRGCPALPLMGWLQPAWNSAAEESADARASANDADRRFDLAHALIRLARLAPAADLPAGVSAFYHGGSIETRVRLLLDPPVLSRPGYDRLVAALGTAALALTFVILAPAIHAAMETLVRSLP